MQILKDSESLILSAKGWTSVWHQQKIAPPPEITLVEGYKGRRRKNGQDEGTSWQETEMEQWRANLYQLLFYAFLSLPSHVHNLI